MWRICFESNSGSYAGRIAPPGMPKTVSTPTSSSERMRHCAPVTCSVMIRFLVGFRVVDKKKPPGRDGVEGLRAGGGTRPSASAHAKYEDVAEHGRSVAVPLTPVKSVRRASHLPRRLADSSERDAARGAPRSDKSSVSRWVARRCRPSGSPCTIQTSGCRSVGTTGHRPARGCPARSRRSAGA